MYVVIRFYRNREPQKLYARYPCRMTPTLIVIEGPGEPIPPATTAPHESCRFRIRDGVEFAANKNRYTYSWPEVAFDHEQTSPEVLAAHEAHKVSIESRRKAKLLHRRRADAVAGRLSSLRQAMDRARVALRDRAQHHALTATDMQSTPEAVTQAWSDTVEAVGPFREAFQAVRDFRDAEAAAKRGAPGEWAAFADRIIDELTESERDIASRIARLRAESAKKA